MSFATKIVNKPWGHEVIFALTKDYVGKVLVIKAGHQLSLQFHKVKEETIYIQSGEMKFLLENDKGVIEEMLLKPGMSAHIAPQKTPHLDDVVRLEDKYGRLEGSGSAS
jgi:mannose-6-phosphate isomerase